MPRGRSVLTVLAVLFAFWYGHDRGLQSMTKETHDSLCALRADIAQRQQDTRDFLDDVAHGRRARINGISDADLRRSIDNQQATLDALESLRCE